MFFFGFSLAHARAAEGNAKLLFGVAAVQMAFVGGCASLVSYHVSRMTRAVLNAIELLRK
jgi:tartrate dehydratase beta subunit/fumarate hydratase class I family protein